MQYLYLHLYLKDDDGKNGCWKRKFVELKFDIDPNQLAVDWMKDDDHGDLR